MESNEDERGAWTWVGVEDAKDVGEYLPQTIPSALVSQAVESPNAWRGEDEWAA